MTRLLIVLAILLLGSLLLVMNASDGRIAGLTGDQIAYLVYYLPMIALMGAGIVAARKNWSQSARNFLIWLVIILALATISLFREDAKRIGARLLGELHGDVRGPIAVITVARTLDLDGGELVRG